MKQKSIVKSKSIKANKNNMRKEEVLSTKENDFSPTQPIKEVKFLNENETVINSFDFSALELLDPLLTEGHKGIFNKEITIEIRKNNFKLDEKVRLRILTIGEEMAPANVRIELSSDSDIFFYYLNELDLISFRKLQEEQKLKCNFGEFIPTIKKLISVSALSNTREEGSYFHHSKKIVNPNENINNTINNINTNTNNNILNNTTMISQNNDYNNKVSNVNKTNNNFYSTVKPNKDNVFYQSTKIVYHSINNTSDQYKIVLNLINEENANLDFVKLLGHKEITVLSINFMPMSEDFMKKMISYRFNYTRSKIVVFKERIDYVLELVKNKNPCLYDQICRQPAKLTKEFIESKLRGEIYFTNDVTTNSNVNTNI